VAEIPDLRVDLTHIIIFKGETKNVIFTPRLIWIED